MSLAYCVKQNKPCVRWVEKFFKDCLCNISDDLSFGFGLISLVCWGVAEVPQIITNFYTKSSHGVSLSFLLTWIAGDIFNLVGCVLEPATDEDEIKPLKPGSTETSIPIPKASSKASSRKEYYYMSARSLASSGTPPFRTDLRAAQSGPSAMGLDNDSSSDDEASPPLSSVSQPRPIPRSAAAGYGTFLAASLGLPVVKSKALSDATAGITGRKLLQHGGSTEHSALGQGLGWLMAAIYMGGRIPQIWLNGLNPLMFVFALAANVTYVLSIVVRNTEWENIKANLPWLLDAIVCVVLDAFIILQYIYYRNFRKKREDYGEDNKGDYLDASKAIED
ncbi:hypothetical protein LWI28_017029 [Acer negundo]|uniref:Vacuolar amino acid transporter YPQ1 n=1 Tax=Acer negundo TaxID=4023 RepID=A0AAD5IK17_ACENE|nr:hypothetical protein LWI28_017029 [Acer negundo]